MNSAADHTHCDLGLFHSADPLHTHAHCKSCYRMRRCEGGDMKLLRCTGCFLFTYCSKECQKSDWRDGHKYVCKMYAHHKDLAVDFSGNPNAWAHLASFIEYHHATLINGALACYLRGLHENRDIAVSHFLQATLLYKNDPTLPPHDQFIVETVHLLDNNAPKIPAHYAMYMTDRPVAVDMGKMELGNRYWGTGVYLLMVKFAPGRVPAIPYWKHFGIDKEHARARPACRSPYDQFRENIYEGKKLSFCCGRIEGVPTCCCGGWTQELNKKP